MNWGGRATFSNPNDYTDILEIHDDRVEITNPGGLPTGLNRKNFGKTSVPRNKFIASLMLRAGYIKDMGTGIKRRGCPPFR